MLVATCSAVSLHICVPWPQYFCMQKFLSTPVSCSVGNPPVRCVNAMNDAGLADDESERDWRRVVMLNKFPFPGDMDGKSNATVLVFLHPPDGITPLEYMLKPNLALVSLHMHIRGTATVHTVIRSIPQERILPHPELHCCAIHGWDSYRDLAKDPYLPLRVVPAVHLYMAACVNKPTREILRLPGVEGPMLNVVPFI